ncbi:hypothetical protein K488DRAFT_77814 [Vararia minispora EC-137]|uniref:Uncharacterized protein n=1 Tax=Vararia minispora EC-137 TaxID=1314806 RepID=A0ACB8QP91_9AGAM|nr:hypothetical protein K488DRAFT_77814 [Vararia minispora EC-137]
MSISTRIGISWSGGEQHEPTDTLVLTGKSYFVDVRIKRNDKRLDWAFAGTKSSEPGPIEGQTHSAWHHTIDSRSTIPVKDEGILFPDPSDPTKTIERGSMLNPETGSVEEYEECWNDIEPPSGSIVAFLEKEDGMAMVGIIGSRRLGIGRGFAWRMEGGRMVFTEGETEGTDVAIPVGEPIEPGDKLGRWIVREYWTSA